MKQKQLSIGGLLNIIFSKINFIMGRGFHYNIRKDKTYFMTMTVEDWIDLFTRVNQKQLIVDSLKYCQENKGLNIFGWCLMPSHLHLIANTKIPWDKNHAIELYTERVTWQKLNYIHRNPVVDKVVYKEQDYLFSLARNYYGLPNVLEIDCLTPPVTTVSSRNFFNT